MFGKLFPNNEHIVERVVRIFLGVALLAVAMTVPHAWWGWLGIIPLATGLLGSCPLYTLTGVSTNKHTTRTA